MSRTRLPAWAAAAAALLLGCQKSDFPPLYPAAGKVVFEDGKALNHGVIEFASDADPQWRGSARVEPDGRFQNVATTRSDGKSAAGLVAGKHKVCVSRDPSTTDRNGTPMSIPTKYSNFGTTDLEATVAAGPNDLTITLKPDKPAK